MNEISDKNERLHNPQLHRGGGKVFLVIGHLGQNKWWFGDLDQKMLVNWWFQEGLVMVIILKK